MTQKDWLLLASHALGSVWGLSTGCALLVCVLEKKVTRLVVVCGLLSCATAAVLALTVVAARQAH